jgi:hypothetical protein
MYKLAQNKKDRGYSKILCNLHDRMPKMDSRKKRMRTNKDILILNK